MTTLCVKWNVYSTSQLTCINSKEIYFTFIWSYNQVVQTWMEIKASYSTFANEILYLSCFRETVVTNLYLLKMNAIWRLNWYCSEFCCITIPSWEMESHLLFIQPSFKNYCFVNNRCLTSITVCFWLHISNPSEAAVDIITTDEARFECNYCHKFTVCNMYVRNTIKLWRL